MQRLHLIASRESPEFDAVRLAVSKRIDSDEHTKILQHPDNLNQFPPPRIV